MKLEELLRQVSVGELHADLNMEIREVAYDSRKVTQGAMFVAVSGFQSDGNRFIPMAMEKGAAVVVTATKPEQDIPYVLVENDRLALAQIGCNFYGRPADSLKLIGITGTNGKTSATWLLKQVLEKLEGCKAGLIGTMENRIGDLVLPTDRTTPESFELQGLFAQMRDGGCKYAIMEVSSHAIALHRVGGIRFCVAGFTNLTEDHLDFHKTMESYCDTKAELFARCDGAVLNADDAWVDRMAEKADCPIVYTSAKTEKGLYAKNVELRANGIAFTAVSDGEEIPVKLPIPGRFTVYNALTVLGVVKALGLSLRSAARVLEEVQGVKGRIEVVPTPGKDYTVLIDYAHTPDGLDNVLRSVRDFCKGRLICVFGCGGDRDPIKRPIMGRIGVELSDIAILTSDNPRTEDPGAILQDIAAGISPELGEYKMIENRVQAIEFAMDIGKKDDIIVLAGKGHETYQEIHGVKYPMDERQIVAQYLMEKR